MKSYKVVVYFKHKTKGISATISGEDLTLDEALDSIKGKLKIEAKEVLDATIKSI